MAESPDPTWKITSGYRFSYKYGHGSPYRSNLTPLVQLLLEGGSYGHSVKYVDFACLI